MKSARLLRTAVVLALALAGLAFTAAPAQAATTAACPAAVRVTPAIEIYDNNPHGSEDVGTLYLDYIGGTCRQALAEMNLKAKYIAEWDAGIFAINICIHNTANNVWYGCYSYPTPSYYNNGTFVESQKVSIDSAIYNNAEASMSLTRGWNGVDTSCGGDSQSHNFANGANTPTKATGLWGSCHA